MPDDLLHITLQEKGRADTFAADVAPDCSGEEILNGLVDAGYLGPPTADRRYDLTVGRTGRQMPTTMTLEAAEVIDGEVITIAPSVHGAVDGDS